MVLTLVVAALAGPAPYAEVERALASFSAAVAASDVDGSREWLHPACLQIVRTLDSEMVLDVDRYLGAMQAGHVGGHPVDLTVSSVNVSGQVATASTVRPTNGMVLVHAVTLV